MADEREKSKAKSNEEMQREILEVELQTKHLQLAEARKRNADFEEAERRRHDANQKRMSELAEGRRNHAATVKHCRHQSGGSPANVLRGGGRFAFSLIQRTIMPDGVTVLLTCPRCRMMMYPPSEAMKKADAKQYKADLEEYNRLLQKSIDEGIEHNESRGPTFMFKNAEGVPIIPERV